MGFPFRFYSELSPSRFFPSFKKKNLSGKVHQEPENEKEKENSLERRKFYFSASFTGQWGDGVEQF